jgi:hypothetical protein
MPLAQGAITETALAESAGSILTPTLVSTFKRRSLISVLPKRRFVSRLRVNMPQGRDFSQADAGESPVVTLDFGDWLSPTGITIASVVSVTATNYFPPGGSAYVSLEGSAQIGTAPTAAVGSGVTNAAILQQFNALAAGEARITAEFTTSDGQTLIGWAHVKISTPN